MRAFYKAEGVFFLSSLADHYLLSVEINKVNVSLIWRICFDCTQPFVFLIIVLNYFLKLRYKNASKENWKLAHLFYSYKAMLPRHLYKTTKLSST